MCAAIEVKVKISAITEPFPFPFHLKSVFTSTMFSPPSPRTSSEELVAKN